MVMLIVRPAEKKDLGAIYHLIQQGTGLTSLPANKAIIANYLNRCAQTFKSKSSERQDRTVILVMENIAKKQIIGISGIISNAGANTPFFSYRLANITRVSPSLKLHHCYQQLHLVNDFQNATELCMLYLHPNYRHAHYGEWLSRARLLLMAHYHRWFNNPLIAEIRGISDQNGISPFWQSLGKVFLKMDFKTADYLTTTTNKQFIIDLMPRQAIYVSLLPKKARSVIGKPHRDARGALKILKREGLTYQGYIDIFDAGPTISGTIQDLRTVKQSSLVKIASIHSIVEGKEFLLMMLKPKLRIVHTVIGFINPSEIQLAPEVAKTLGLKVGDEIRIAPWR